MPLKADRFLRAAIQNLEPLRGTFVHAQVIRDLREKTEQVDSGYARWLAGLLPWLGRHCGLARPARVLDFGCGSGELTVLMNSLGYDAVGLEVHGAHLRLARILAEENGLSADRFVLSQGGPLSFPDGSFDIVTMSSVFEHLSDEVLDQVLPELARVCVGALFVLVPNRLKTRDDHTGLALINWLPRGLAALCVRASGPYHRYGISQDGSWDVHPRTYWAVRQRLERHGFRVGFVPDEVVFPPLETARPLFELGSGRGWKSLVLAPVRWLCRALLATGTPRQAFYPYLNLVMTRAERRFRPDPQAPDATPGRQDACP
jgi:ubiquinone/menaquinone biosynthesis C-methylase UbiE